MLIEAVLTFSSSGSSSAPPSTPPGSLRADRRLAIGFAVAMGLMVGAPFTDAAMNPARSFGPVLVSGQWTGAWVYWVGPIIGGAAAAFPYDIVNSHKQVATTSTPVNS